MVIEDVLRPVVEDVGRSVGGGECSIGGGSGSIWTILKSGVTWYRRGINPDTLFYVLDYSSDSGATWETLVNLVSTEDNVIIDSGNLYRHRIVGTSYRVDNTLTSTGYLGIENIDWENLYST